MDRQPIELESQIAGISFDWDVVSDVPQIERVCRYWYEKRGERTMPSRNEIAPSEIKDVLPFVQLYDILDGGKAYRVRLLGTEITRAFDKDPTGMTFDSTSEHLLVKRMLAVFERVIARRKPVIVRADRTAIDKLSYAPIESAYFPLSENGSKVDVIFAATVVDHAHHSRM